MQAVEDGGSSSAVPGRQTGVTESERYLGELCQRNFLTLWSYPRPFRDQGGGKELCDLLVVMGDDVIVFSDKHCNIDTAKPREVAWKRWFKAAVQGGAKQAWGAERWLREHPNRVFVDEACTTPLPVQLPAPDVARYHLVVTVHGIADACKSVFGGSGSLMLRTTVTDMEGHASTPFSVGELDTSRTFVHVFDDTTLDIIMQSLDTAPDFLQYLREKERLCRSKKIEVAGEENLLAYYLSDINANGEHALEFGTDHDPVAIDETWWPAFEGSEERRAKIEHDAVSYLWDALIERFAEHALKGTLYETTAPAFSSTETVMRILAGESRFRRRMLAGALMDAVESTPPDMRFIRRIPSQSADEPTYVFVLVPWFDDRSEDENRALRRRFLEASVRVVRMKAETPVDIVGIATESGNDMRNRSEDVLYLDGRHWTDEDDAHARQLQEELQILVAEKPRGVHMEEYPVTGRASSGPTRRKKHPRNAPCFCGSGVKYKRCHGAR